MKPKPNRRPLRSFLRLSAAIGATGLLSMGMPTGCSSSIPPAPELYRLQNQTNNRALLPDVTVERLQACVDESATNLDDGAKRVEATVQVNQDGQVLNVTLEGVPEGAADLATCTRLALRAMDVSALPLRSHDAPDEKDRPAPSGGNEMANPLVLGEALIVLAEFMAQHGGRAILYAVTLEVAAATTVAAVHELRKRRRKTCVQHLSDCLMMPTADERGNHWNHGRCSACFAQCRDGHWPETVHYISGPESCKY
ncbi:MAG TPA: hypothetical protein PKA58_32410 [Polyangium sp.]|nr:hypothetical protein [Polyangium sp.]